MMVMQMQLSIGSMIAVFGKTLGNTRFVAAAFINQTSNTPSPGHYVQTRRHDDAVCLFSANRALGRPIAFCHFYSAVEYTTCRTFK
jgi:hypothetical protein